MRLAASAGQPPVEPLDLRAVLKASQALSQEIVLDELIKTLMAIALDNTGADSGMLLLLRGGRRSIAARAWAGAGGVEVCLVAHRPEQRHAPMALLDAVIEERRSLGLDDGGQFGSRGGDTYLRRRMPSSAIAVPLLKKAELIGVLYLEHASRAGVFAQPRVDMLELLAIQTAISLDHAHLYQQLQSECNQRLQAEDALRQAQCELARMARITAMGEFAASIAHEVTQPIAAVALNTSAAISWLQRQPPDVAQARAALDMTLRSATCAGEVVRGIRALASKSGPALAPFVVDEAIREVLLLMAADLRKHGITVLTSLTLAQRQAHADRAQLQQLLMNLILNAIDAMAGVAGRAPTLEVRSLLADDAGTLRISVADNGSGIDAASSARLFDPLFSTKPGGMGLGLSICRSIIEAHGGRIWNSTDQAHGSTFHLSLPAPRDAAHD